MVSLKIRKFGFWVLCLGAENLGLDLVFGDRKYGFDFCVWCFGGVGIWNMVLSFVFRPIWVWIQIFWVLNFMFIFSKSMAEDPWLKPHGWRSMVETHLDRDLIFSLSKPRWSPWFDLTSSWLCFGVFYWWGLALSFSIFGILFLI